MKKTNYVVNFDFAQLYPHVMRKIDFYPTIRLIKISNILKKLKNENTIN